MRRRRNRDFGDLGESGSGSGSGWRSVWMSLRDEQENLQERDRVGPDGSVAGRILRCDVSHVVGGHMIISDSDCVRVRGNLKNRGYCTHCDTATVE